MGHAMDACFMVLAYDAWYAVAPHWRGMLALAGLVGLACAWGKFAEVGRGC